MSLISQVSASDVAVDDEIINQNTLDDEILAVEDSQVVSTTYSPSSGDDLQKCIDGANDGDTIILNGTYYLKNTLNINKPISIVGAGEGATIQKDDFSFYKIQYMNVASSNVVLNNLKFVNGQNQYGGAVFWSGDNGTVMNCQFVGNIVVNDGFGGAIDVTGKNICIENSLFTNNRATKGTGGAISIQADGAVIKNCQFVENKVDNGSAGAIYLFANDCVIENCNFTDNYCTDFGGAICVYNKSNRISNSIFRNNDVKNNMSNKGGGAIYSECDDLIVDECNFESNYAKNAFGGAIYVKEHSFIQNSNFTSNIALIGTAIYGSSFVVAKNNYFTIPYNQTEEQTVHVANLTDINNTFEEIKDDSSITFIASMIFEYGDSGTVYVTVEGGSIAPENITVIGHPEAKIIFKDNVLNVSNLAVGEYSLRVVTTPDEAHNSVESFLPITVKKATAVLKATKATVALKSGSSWSITLINSKTKKPIANMKLTLKVYTGSKYKTVTVKTNSKGVATYKTKSLSQGTHKIVVSAQHDGYSFNTLKSSISVIKPIPLTYKVKKTTNNKGGLLSITVYKKANKKPITGVLLKLFIYTGKKCDTVLLKTTTQGKFSGVCGYGTNIFSAGNHKVVIKPVDIKYTGSTTSQLSISKSAKKFPAWTKKVTGKI